MRTVADDILNSGMFRTLTIGIVPVVYMGAVIAFYVGKYQRKPKVQDWSQYTMFICGAIGLGAPAFLTLLSNTLQGKPVDQLGDLLAAGGSG